MLETRDWTLHTALCAITALPSLFSAIVVIRFALGAGPPGWEGLTQAVVALAVMVVARLHWAVSTGGVAAIGGSAGRVAAIHAVSLPLAVGALAAPVAVVWLG